MKYCPPDCVIQDILYPAFLSTLDRKSDVILQHHRERSKSRTLVVLICGLLPMLGDKEIGLGG